MTAEEREALRIAVERDIDVIVRACAPLDWKGGDFKEAKEVTGCLHPFEAIAATSWENGVPTFQCQACNTELSPELVRMRLEVAKRYLSQ